MNRTRINKDYTPLLSLLIIFVISLAIILTMRHNINNTMFKYVPLQTHINKVTTNLAMGHLWLEELIAGDTSIDFETHVHKNLNAAAVQNSRFIQADHDALHTDFDQKVLQKLISIQPMILSFKALAQDRYADPANYIGSKDDVKFDKIYNKLLLELDALHQQIFQKFEKVHTQRLNDFYFTVILFLLINVLLFFTLYRNIQKKYKSDLDIQESTHALENAQKIGNIGSCQRDFITDRHTWSDGLFRLLDEKPQSFSPSYEKIMSYLSKEDQKKNAEVIQQAIADQKKSAELDYIITTKNAQSKYIHTIAEFYYDEKGQAAGMAGTLIDVTQIKKTQQREALLDSLMQKSSDAYYIIDMENARFVDINQTAINTMGYSREEFLNMTAMDLSERLEDIETWYRLQNRARENPELLFETRHRKKDDSMIDIEISYAWATMDNKSYTIAIARDITKRKKDEQKLREQEQLMLAQSRHAAMGEMISMIAHQWRQPLTALGSDTNLLLLDAELKTVDPQEVKKTAHHMLKKIQYLSKTIDDFRNFFKSDKEKSNTYISDIMENILNMLQNSLERYDITVDKTYHQTTPVKTYPNELQQVFINIINNAKDAFNQQQTGSKEIKIACKESENSLIITISDNAGGIPDDILPKIFEPYFSTKDAKTGTGLGLYMSKLIIEDHLQGTLTAANGDNGACFTITLPLS